MLRHDIKAIIYRFPSTTYDLNKLNAVLWCTMFFGVLLLLLLLLLHNTCQLQYIEDSGMV